MEEIYKLEGKRILVTGGRGFLGSIIVRKLKEKGAEVFAPDSKEYDLRKEEGVERLFKDLSPEIVIFKWCVVLSRL